ncbi:MAG: hypothetical protein RIT27_2441 [Pseudomonadota bacterium]|jgi:Uri superfamily endonuclease
MFFKGRDEHLNYFEQLCHAKTGAAYIISGDSGTGKSLLLRQFKDICKKKQLPYLFIDLTHFLPDSTAVNTLQNFTKADLNWADFQRIIETLQNTYPNHRDITAFYQKPLPKTTDLTTESIIPKEKSRFELFFETSKTLLKHWGTTKTNPLIKNIGNPEKFLLENLKIACQNNPIILIDSYEHLYQNPRLMNKRLQIMMDFHGEQLVPLNQVEQPLLIDWFDALLEWLIEQGAIVIIASEQLGQIWQRNTIKIRSFSNTEQLFIAQQYDGERIRTIALRYNQDLMRILDRFSFKGNPLWFNVALNVVEELLAEELDLTPLAFHKKELKECFDFSLDQIEEVDCCKLALIYRLFKRESDIHQLWKIALVHYLDRNILAVLFGEQADTIRFIFQKAGLLSTNHQAIFVLHAEIHRLFLNFTKQQGFLEHLETQMLYVKLIQYFEKRVITEENPLLKNLLQEEIKQLKNQVIEEPKTDIAVIQPISGTYILILEATEQINDVRIGRLGKITVEKGFYVYVGSAFGLGGLQSRIKRQLQIPRKKHWHIDYLRSVTNLKEVWFSYDEQRRECEWAVVFSQLAAFSQPVKGFGSSDCESCFSHLFYSHHAPIFETLQTHFSTVFPLKRAIF